MRTRSGVIAVVAAAALSLLAIVFQQWSLTRYDLVLDLPECIRIRTGETGGAAFG